MVIKLHKKSNINFTFDQTCWAFLGLGDIFQTSREEMGFCFDISVNPCPFTCNDFLKVFIILFMLKEFLSDFILPFLLVSQHT
jgi:hypothetical protein